MHHSPALFDSIYTKYAVIELQGMETVSVEGAMSGSLSVERGQHH